MIDETVVARNASVIEIDINKLGISEKHLVRPIDDQHVASLVETDEQQWDMIEVRVWPAEWEKPSEHVEYHVISGNHRTTAARIKGLDALRAKVVDADSELDYLVAAIRTNTRHGRNFTEDERRTNAAKLKKQGMSASDIAKLFGVHKSTVNNWLSGRDSNASRKRAKTDDHVASNDPDGDIWNEVPVISLDAKKLATIGQRVNDALAEILALEKTELVSWVASNPPEVTFSLIPDIAEAIQVLTALQCILQKKGA